MPIKNKITNALPVELSFKKRNFLRKTFGDQGHPTVHFGEYPFGWTQTPQKFRLSCEENAKFSAQNFVPLETNCFRFRRDKYVVKNTKKCHIEFRKTNNR